MLRSDWTVAQVLNALSGAQRIDDGIDLLAARVVGTIPNRSAYVYLYGDDPSLISFDLEDEASDLHWDHAVRRGEVRSLDQLCAEVLPWLGLQPQPANR